jgi:hypothetical protein
VTFSPKCYLRSTFGFHAKRAAGSGTGRDFDKAPLHKLKRLAQGSDKFQKKEMPDIRQMIN